MASIQQRGNSYLLSVSLMINGRPKRRTETWAVPHGMSKREAEREALRRADEFERKIKSGYDFDPMITFSGFSALWLKEYSEKQHRNTTIARNEGLIERINDGIGDVRLAKLQPQHIRDFLSEIAEKGMRQDKKYICNKDIRGMLKEKRIKYKDFVSDAGIAYSTFLKAAKGETISYETVRVIASRLGMDENTDFRIVSGGGKYSGKTLLHYYRLISKILTDAVRWGYIYDNPCDRVTPPKMHRKKVDYLTDEQIGLFVSTLLREEEPFRTAVYLLLHLCCRRGELLGLHWDDIDFAGCKVEINKALLYTPREGVHIDRTKTDESERTVIMSRPVMDMLREYKTWQDKQSKAAGDRWADTGFVFTDWCGRPIRPDRLTKWMSSFVVSNKLSKITNKGLRHTGATLLIMNGMNARSIADRLGHAKTSTTLDIYSHAFKSVDATAADLLYEAVNRSTDERTETWEPDKTEERD
jgi:integrase